MALDKNVMLMMVIVALLSGAGVFAVTYATLTQRPSAGGAQGATSSSLPGYGPGMMNGYTTTTSTAAQTTYTSISGTTSTQGSSATQSRTYPPSGMLYIQDLIKQMQSPPPYANVVRANNTIIFTSHDMNLTVLSMGGDRARNLRGCSCPLIRRITSL